MIKKQLKQRLGCLILCLALACGLTCPAAAAGFTDVPASHWAAADIDRCVKLGFFQGESASRFGVGHPMTRAAFAVVLSRFFGWTTTAPTKAPFTDVPANAWYAGAVQAAAAGAWLHGRAGDLAQQELTAYGTTPEDTVHRLPAAIREILE